MSSLDLKVPPPLVALVCALLAWALAAIAPAFALRVPYRVPAALLIGMGGVVIALWAVMAFRRARTTINPHTPEASSRIVQTGPYRFTRNPMYLGLALLLFAWCVYLGRPLSLIAVVVFVAYVTRYQIVPEERAIERKFGESYARYRASVRRWL